MTTYEYIIVGAGSAGAALAARLSEDVNRRVLLLEAGPDFRSADAPGEMRESSGLQIIRRGDYHWPRLLAQLTEVQKPILYLRGLGVGGSSSINATGAVRGLPDDYDAWESQGCAGWGWSDVRAAFIRLENDHDFADRAYHGDSGPLPIERTAVGDWGAVAKAFGEAATAAGFPWCDDINAPGARGIYPGPRNTRGGLRVTTNDAYLETARERSNLTILGNAHVDGIVFDRRRAVGLRVDVSGTAQTIEGGTVVLSAGAIGSPAILMRSGIGDAAHLRALDITVVSDLPAVGTSLCDHPLVEIRLDLDSSARSSPASTLAYHCGLRTTSDLADANEDLSMFVANYGENVDQGALAVALMQPVSRGRLLLRSANPASQPWIEFRMMTDDRDCAGLRDGIRLALNLARHTALSRICRSAWAPDLTEMIVRDDYLLTTWLRTHCEPFFHAAGTCRMGAADDARSVVDPACRVRGVEDLLVCDASIIPTPPRAPTHLTVVMLAEHLAAQLHR